MVVMLFVKELEDRKTNKRRGSKVGQLCIPWTACSATTCSCKIISPRYWHIWLISLVDATECVGLFSWMGYYLANAGLMSSVVNICEDHLKSINNEASWICEGTRGMLKRHLESFWYFASSVCYCFGRGHFWDKKLSTTPWWLVWFSIILSLSMIMI
jgi:hypothetical protein